MILYDSGFSRKTGQWIVSFNISRRAGFAWFQFNRPSGMRRKWSIVIAGMEIEREHSVRD